MEALQARSSSLLSCQITNEEAYRKGENDFDLSVCELESFIALQYVRTLTYFIFFTIKLYGILIFSENMSHLD